MQNLANSSYHDTQSDTHHHPATAEQTSTSYLSQEAARLAAELANRSTTDRTFLRKTQLAVSKSLNAASGPMSAVPSSRQGNVAATNSTTNGSAATTMGSLVADRSNFFMPKRSIQRADGATLHDIYLSKQGDTWSKILQAQLAEEERQKRRDKLAKEEQNNHYGHLLHEQVRRQEEVSRQREERDKLLSQLEDTTSKRSDDIQRRRQEDAIRRHKQFVANAMEDVAYKQVIRQEDLRQDLSASTVMMQTAQTALAAEEVKKAGEKAYFKAYQDEIYLENVRNLEKKAATKLSSHAEDKRIVAEQERQYQREVARREAEVAQRAKRSSMGPAHHIVQEIVERKKESEQALYTMLFQAENDLNRQLKASEEGAKLRAASNGASLTEEWIKNADYKARKKAEDEERNTRILATMQQMLKDQEAQEIARREAQKKAQLEYQRALDAQVNAMRQRSFDNLTKTMSEQEIRYNSDLIKKTNVQL